MYTLTKTTRWQNHWLVYRAITAKNGPENNLGDGSMYSAMNATLEIPNSIYGLMLLTRFLEPDSLKTCRMICCLYSLYHGNQSRGQRGLELVHHGNHSILGTLLEWKSCDCHVTTMWHTDPPWMSTDEFHRLSLELKKVRKRTVPLRNIHVRTRL